MKFGHISLSVRTTALGRTVRSALLTKFGKSSGLYMSTSRSVASRAATVHPVEEVVDMQNRTSGSASRHSRMSCPATWTSPTLTACIQTKPSGPGWYGSCEENSGRSPPRRSSGYSAKRSPNRLAYPPRRSIRIRNPGNRNGYTAAKSRLYIIHFTRATLFRPSATRMATVFRRRRRP